MTQTRPLVALAAHLGRGVQRVAADGVLRGARAFPRRIADLDAPRVSQILGRTVTSVSVLGGDAGTTSRARLALDDLDTVSRLQQALCSDRPVATSQHIHHNL